jgi:MerR family mercuric resistance operon transcriptional regulator
MVSGASTTARAVRFYEAEKLIQAAFRSRGGHRLFDPAELGKLRLVIDLRTCGFSIDEIREILDAKTRGGSAKESAQAVRKLLIGHVEELRRKIATIERLGRELSVSVELLDRCAQCMEPRGLQACATCELPRLPQVPPSFHHIWAGPAPADGCGTGKSSAAQPAPPSKLPEDSAKQMSAEPTLRDKNQTVG